MSRQSRVIRPAILALAPLGCVLLSGCAPLMAFLQGALASHGGTPLVSMQITEDTDPVAFERVIDELEARDIRCTLIVDDTFVAQNCDRIRELADAGFEIMAYARPPEPEGQVVTMTMLSYDEQETLITRVKTAIDDCLGTETTGIRCYRFDQNDDTYAIIDLLGFQLNLGFVAHTTSCLPAHQDDVLPYQGSEYSFLAVPMHSVNVGTRWAAFCDMPFSSYQAADWQALLTSELDGMTAQGYPLLVEFHPYFTGVDEGRFAAFVNFLDYAVARNAQFMTAAELVEWTNASQAADPCQTCGQ
ncbi:MAG TPA: polysaccharide deacetylase family protein [Phycisphaerae bacterium]|nr:polysaccharide deacetylase family protein [Phycisphaerae bacterium]